MAPVPEGLQSYERFLNADEYTVRRQVLTTTTARPSGKHHTQLPAVFEGAHPWPLQWGGAEVKEAHWFAHDLINNSFQKRLENAGRRFAERLQGTDYRLFAVSAVTRYPERNLLERATYRFEAVDRDGKVIPLGEITVEQSLTKAQRKALVEGKVVQGAKGGTLVIEHGSKEVRIKPERMVKLPTPELFGAVDTRINELVEGFQTKSGGTRTTPRPQATPTTTSTTPARRGQQSTASSTRKPAKPPSRRTAVEGRGVEARGTEPSARATEPVASLPPPSQAANGSKTRVVVPPSPVRVQPSVQELVRPPASEALSGQNATQNAVAGAAMELYSMQLRNMRAKADADAEAAVQKLDKEISKWRAAGDYVLVRVTFAVPESQDVLGWAPDSYPIFWGAQVSHAGLITETPVGKMDPEWVASHLMHSLRNQPATMGVQGSEGNRKVPPGRKLVTQDYKIYEPYPPALTNSPAAVRARRTYQSPEEKWRGITDRCTQ